jgi:type III pantothenate kinase
MYNLVIDIGNSNSKVAVFKGKDLVHHQIFRKISSDDLSELIGAYNIEHSTASSVSESLKDLETVLKKKTKYVQFSTEIRTGIKNNYKSSSTLGLDRWAKVIAAFYNYPDQNCFMIDAGTCITYDFLNHRGEYFGGSISLGINMRFMALSHFTGRLPLVQWDKSLNSIPQGIDTVTAIQNGVLQGVINEVDGFISLQCEQNEDVKVLITGGDAAFLSGQLKNSIFAPNIINDPYLVLKGLNEVIALEYV